MKHTLTHPTHWFERGKCIYCRAAAWLDCHGHWRPADAAAAAPCKGKPPAPKS
jgi:hypothetical protein